MKIEQMLIEKSFPVLCNWMPASKQLWKMSSRISDKTLLQVIEGSILAHTLKWEIQREGKWVPDKENFVKKLNIRHLPGLNINSLNGIKQCSTTDSVECLLFTSEEF